MRTASPRDPGISSTNIHILLSISHTPLNFTLISISHPLTNIHTLLSISHPLNFTHSSQFHTLLSIPHPLSISPSSQFHTHSQTYTTSSQFHTPLNVTATLKHAHTLLNFTLLSISHTPLNFTLLSVSHPLSNIHTPLNFTPTLKHTHSIQFHTLLSISPSSQFHTHSQTYTQSSQFHTHSQTPPATRTYTHTHGQNAFYMGTRWLRGHELLHVGARRRRDLSLELPRDTGSRPNSADLSIFSISSFFPKFWGKQTRKNDK